MLHRWNGVAVATDQAHMDTIEYEDGDALKAQRGDYRAVATTDASRTAVAAAKPLPQKVAPVGMSHASVEEVRSTPHSALVAQLQAVLLQISSSSPAAPAIDDVSCGLDPDTPISSLGFDSMTLVQFKGALENRYYCKGIPDEFMFTPMATLNELAKTITEGTLTETQQSSLDAALASQGGGDKQTDGTAAASGSGQQAPLRSAPVVEMRKEPCCPWFTCCY